ncbi:hypothetical protein C4578_00640 [Candidatus Microgenomates bacterium]|jgi:purine-cytosine permease-like protein|nr:MAG: hypothetical protein C4578_00640 [Candidatus Microgenomates bacterium]
MQIPYLNQALLFLVVTVLTTLLAIAGVQVIHILKEFRQTAAKLNKIVDDCQLISSSVAKPVAGLSGFITGLKSGSDFISFFLKNKTQKTSLKEPKDE